MSSGNIQPHARARAHTRTRPTVPHTPTLHLARIETPCNPHDIPYTTPPAVGSGGVHHNNPPESEWRLQEKTKPGTPNQTKPFPRLTLALAIIT